MLCIFLFIVGSEIIELFMLEVMVFDLVVCGVIGLVFVELVIDLI